MSALLKILGWVGNAREWLLLLALAGVAAATYAYARHIAADRDAWAAWARETCAAAGTTPDAATIEVTTTDGKQRKVQKDRGQRCREAVGDLAAFRAQTQADTAATLANAAAEHASKTTNDIAAARAAAERRHAAAADMEKANAQIPPDDRVDGNWFAALNRLAGLHDRD